MEVIIMCSRSETCLPMYYYIVSRFMNMRKGKSVFEISNSTDCNHIRHLMSNMN